MRTIALLLAFVVSSMTIDASYANAQMVSTQEVVESINLESARENIVTFINAENVQAQMISMGVNPQEAIKRVASLSAKELNMLSQEIDQARAGGDAGVGSVLGIVLLVFIILLITDILGFTKVFPFTRAVQ